MELWSWARGATNVADMQGTGVSLCRALEGVDGSQTIRFPAWYACHGGGENDTVVCSSTDSVYEHQTSASNENWSSVFSTTNLRFMTDSTSSTWWAFEGRRETPPDERTGFTGPAWIDCDGYYAYGGEVDGDGDHRGSMRRALEGEERPSTDQHPGPQAKHDPTEQRVDRFVGTTDDECDSTWASWPAVQEAAVARGTVVVFNVFPSVGNMFVILHNIIKTARLLEVALLLNWQRFEGFRKAFDPASIKWDLEPTTFVQQAAQRSPGAEAERLYTFTFPDGQMVLSHWQLETIARKVDLPDTSVAETATALEDGYSKTGGLGRLSREIVKNELVSVPPCAWNILLRRSPAMMASLEAHNPWTPHGSDPRPKEYVAWHIRTSDGESKGSFTPHVHRYIFHHQSSTTVFPIYLSATDAAERICPRVFDQDVPITPVYISSNSKSMARNCTALAATLAAEHKVGPGFVDLGIDDVDAHTTFSKNPKVTALNAFIDYLYLMDSSVIVQTGSSFSFTVASIKGMSCFGVAKPEGLPVMSLNVCLPADC